MSRPEQEKSDLLQFNYSRKARSFFTRHEDVRDTFEENIVSLYLKGRTDGIDVRKMSGNGRWIRMRINSYRVIYTIVKGRLVVVDVVLAGNRGDL